MEIHTLQCPILGFGFCVFQRISLCSSGRPGTHAPLPQPSRLQLSYNGSNTQESTNSSEGLQGKITVNILFEWFCFWKDHHARLEMEYSMPQIILNVCTLLKRSNVLSRLDGRAGGRGEMRPPSPRSQWRTSLISSFSKSGNQGEEAESHLQARAARRKSWKPE